MNELSRREALYFLIGGAIAAFSSGYAQYGFASEDSNFKHIYLDPKLREQFFLFLKNIFHLYPEQDFHDLILKHASSKNSDKEIYQAILADLPGIKPVLSQIRYALPALKKQKQIMCEQTLALLDGRKKFDGYLEVGTTGRYYDKLSNQIQVSGNKYFVHSNKPTFGAADIVERGSIRKIGSFQDLNNYAPLVSDAIKESSLDLVTVYIGFHHSPLANRPGFIQSCQRVLRKGGILVVRDHDVNSNDMAKFVALAHDVFNAGLELPWEADQAEIRNFTSLNELEKILKNAGFIADQRRLLQPGDPTENTLIKFVKA